MSNTDDVERWWPRDVEESSLLRVLGLGQSVQVGDARLDLLAVEVRTSGIVLHWTLHTATFDQMALGDPVFYLVPSFGGRIHASVVGGGGGSRITTGRAFVRADPIRLGKSFRVVCERFEAGLGIPPFPEATSLEGPWEFSVIDRG